MFLNIFILVIPPHVLIPCTPATRQMISSSNTYSSVVFRNFFNCGFSFHPSNFFLEVLGFYGLELIHLNPNFIIMLSVFVHLCEAFLNYHPSLDLFRYFYVLKRLQKKVDGNGTRFWL